MYRVPKYRLHKARNVAVVTIDGKDHYLAVDYLQLLQLPPESSHVEIRDRIDRVVSDLRRLARELDSPVLVISSLNREGYKAPSLEGFKESGGIEYGADVAIAMWNPAQGSSVYETQGFHTIELHIIKNRNGELATLKYRFQPRFAQFIEIGKGQLAS